MLADVSHNFIRGYLEDVEVDGLSEGSAFADKDDISFLDREGRRHMRRNVAVTLLVSIILGHVVQVIPTHDDSPLHLGGNDNSL